MKTQFRIFYGKTREPLSLTYNAEFDIIEDAYFEETDTALSAAEIEALEETHLEELKQLANNEGAYDESL